MKTIQGKERGVDAHARSGFGLVELMVAMTVGLVVLLGVALTRTVCTDLTRQSRETNTAVADLRAAYETMQSLTLEELVAGDFAPDQPVSAFTDLHLRDERLVVRYPGYAGGAPPDPLHAELTLSWTSFAGHARSITMATAVTR